VERDLVADSGSGGGQAQRDVGRDGTGRQGRPEGDTDADESGDDGPGEQTRQTHSEPPLPKRLALHPRVRAEMDGT
jgi:hypothetical protein